MDLVGEKPAFGWERRSFLEALKANPIHGRDSLLLSQCAWTCQRVVRWTNCICILTYHEGLRDYPTVMPFDFEQDFHEPHDLAKVCPEVVSERMAILEDWTARMMTFSTSAEDPFWRLMREGGPFHIRNLEHRYCNYLRQNNREYHAEDIERRVLARIKERSA